MTGYEATTAVLRDHPEWRDRIRAAYDFTVEQQAKGQRGDFRRDTVYYRLGQDGKGPVLTPLVKWGVIARAWRNAKGTPYYRFPDLDGVGRALVTSDEQQIKGASATPPRPGEPGTRQVASGTAQARARKPRR